MSYFSEELTSIRVSKGLSLGQLSELSGMTPMEISQLENDRRRPSGYDLSRLKKPLGITMDDMVNLLRKG